MIDDILLENEKFLTYLANDNKAFFNLHKANEEASEFAEASLKNVTKHLDNKEKPSRDDIRDEYGDFVYRGMVYLLELYPGWTLEQLLYQVEYRINNKLKKLQGYKNSNKYKGGL